MKIGLSIPEIQSAENKTKQKQTKKQTKQKAM